MDGSLSSLTLTRPAPRRHGGLPAAGSRLRSPRHRVRDKPRATGVATHAATQGHQPHNGQGEVPHTRRRSAVMNKSGEQRVTFVWGGS